MKKLYYLVLNMINVMDFFIKGQWIALNCKDPIIRRQKNIQNTHRICQRFQKSLRFEIHPFHHQRLLEMRDSSYLLVSNHISYTDIIALSSLEKLSFITSVEMGNNPFLGSVTRLGGSLYTDRKNPLSLKEEIRKFSSAIRAGLKVVLFPEATSTDGKKVGTFRRSLFQIAIEAKCPILPVCIKYTHIDGKTINDSNRDRVAWYGDMTFAPHFMALLGHKIRVEIHFLESIAQPHEKTRSELSETVYTQISECYQNIQKSD